MGDLTKNLSRAEFACKCGKVGKKASDGYCEGSQDTIDFELVTALQELVDYYERTTGNPMTIIITSGNRCEKHNADEGGSELSQHRFSKAADFKIFFEYADQKHQLSPDDIADHLESKYPTRCGIGRYINRTHLDMRSTPARWEA